MSGIPLSSNWLKLQSKTNTVPKVNKLNKDIRKKVKVSTSRGDVSDKKVTTLQIFNSTKHTNDNKKSETGVVLETCESSEQQTPTPLKLDEGKLTGKKLEPGKFLAIDCEFVGVGPEGVESALARVSIVNFYGAVILDKYVKPKEKVTDWRTWVSGILPKHMKEAISFREAQQLCSDLFKDRILVGHAIQHDLDALLLSQPIYLIRDTSRHLPFRKISNGKTPGLKKLAKEFLKIDIQGGEHSSVEDARATMMLYRLQKKEFEMAHRQKFGNNNLRKGKTGKGVGKNYKRD